MSNCLRKIEKKYIKLKNVQHFFCKNKFTNSSKDNIIELNKFPPQRENKGRMTEEETKQLINQYLIDLKNGDISKFESLFKLTAGHMYLVAHIYLKNADDAWFAVCEAFRRLGKYISNFNPNKDGLAWLCTITKNLALTDVTRESKVEHVDIDKVEYLIGKDFFEDIELRIDVETAINMLDEPNKTIAQMRFYWEKTQREIARELHLSEAAICQRMAYIKKFIADFCNQD